MLIRIRRGWEISESRATPEHLVASRRRLLGAGVGLAGAGLAGVGLAGQAQAPWLNPSRLFGGAQVPEKPRQKL